MGERSPIAARVYQARTRDRWTLALHRYRVPTLRPRRRRPIVLCHGLGSNRHSFDTPAGPSLARFLAGRGYDVWVLELRGAGSSARPRLFNGLRWEWSFRHYVELDAPAALACISDATGASAVHWVGHSLGGMIAYALLADGRLPLASAVAMAAPTIQILPPFELPGAKLVQALLARLTRVPAGVTARVGAPLTGLAYRMSLFRVLYNPDNMDPAAMRRLLTCALDDVPAPLLLDYVTAFEARRNGEPCTIFSYEQRLHEVRVPLLLVGGVSDGLCPPRSLELVYERVGSAHKRLLLLGRRTGCLHDYGHHDLLLGKNAVAEVYAPLCEWLDERDAAV
jgi:pimeloyl-ACP methyl ester carboxylesterase